MSLDEDDMKKLMMTLRTALISAMAFGIVCAEGHAQSPALHPESGGSQQNFESGEFSNANVLTCSPAPCVLQPTQASEGGNGVLNAPIVADPSTPQTLTVGSTDYNCYPSYVGIHSSRDGGANWNHSCVSSLNFEGNQYYPGGQPMVGYDREEVTYVAAEFAGNESESVVGFQKSSDGITWSNAAVAMSASNAEPSESWLTVDANPQSPWVDSVYISTIFDTAQNGGEDVVVVAHSSDGGARWKQVAVAPPVRFPAFDNFTNLTVDKHGTAYVTWQHCLGTGPGTSCGNHKAYMLFSKSTDGGNHWSSPKLMATITVAPTPCHCGTGILPNTNGIRVYNYPVIGVDNSNGPYAGNLYVVMYTWTGTYMRVVVVRSTDGGTTWSKPVPVAPPSDNHDQFFPWLSVSPTGLVGVSWLDRRNDPANIDYQAFATISSNGGKSFLPDMQLTTAFSNPNANGIIWMGDYTGNTWSGSSNFLAAWMDDSNSTYMQVMVGGIRLH